MGRPPYIKPSEILQIRVSSSVMRADGAGRFDLGLRISDFGFRTYGRVSAMECAEHTTISIGTRGGSANVPVDFGFRISDFGFWIVPVLCYCLMRAVAGWLHVPPKRLHV